MPPMKSIGIWGLREEARKSWDHIISDELIYFVQPLGGNLEVSHPFAEKYLKGEYWFEMHFTARVRKQWEVHFQVIVEVANVSPPRLGRAGQCHGKDSGVGGHRAVLVHIP